MIVFYASFLSTSWGSNTLDSICELKESRTWASTFPLGSDSQPLETWPNYEVTHFRVDWSVKMKMYMRPGLTLEMIPHPWIQTRESMSWSMQRGGLDRKECVVPILRGRQMDKRQKV